VPFPRKLLNEGEDVVLDLHPHWWFFSGPVSAVVLALAAAALLRNVHEVLLLALVALAVAGLLWVAGRYARWAGTNFVVTTDRLVFRQGVLSKRGKEIPLERVDDIAVHQSLFERVIGAGDVSIESGGERGQQVFSDVAKPFSVQNVIYREMERARDREAARAAAHRVLSVPEQIEKLDELRRRGVISQGEFDAKKTQLLERM
jgi:uncharacterized membrane protein YdbT with pleckstrin-like domain